MVKRKPKPGWLKAPIPAGERYFKLKKQLEERKLCTICQQARCPNIAECWNNRHATFLIMGDTCTRNCSFCSVKNGQPHPLYPKEAEHILEMIDILEARYVVITSVTRDDLSDGGSHHFAGIIRTIKSNHPRIQVEVLIPDFQGREEDIARVLDAQPDVLNHNIETVVHLYPHVNRHPQNYYTSLSVLQFAKEKNFTTKSGIMIGLGETQQQMKELFHDLRERGVDLLTIGQYLQPTTRNVPVEKYYTPQEFAGIKQMALSHGFQAVESSPFTRSSYHAAGMLKDVQVHPTPPEDNSQGE